MTVRTRFAPSPTGFMHIGGVRTALYAYLIAKQNDGKFILRIEDTDQQRFVEGAIEVIYESLRDLGLLWDEGPDCGGEYGPYIQSERKNNYMMYAKQLVQEGKAYYCFCDEETIEEGRRVAEENNETYRYPGTCKNIPLSEAQQRVDQGEKFVIRFKMPTTGEITYEDQVYGTITVDNSELEDLIMIKTDGMPTYNFANVVDDHEMAITHIVRGNEYVSSTPKYVQIYEALGWEVPVFIHLPIIKKTANSDKKLSKRDGDSTVESLKSQGFLNKAIINMLALTGWSPGGEQELFSLEELIQVFNVSGISKGNAVFDTNKLKWMNGMYLKEVSFEEFREITYPHLLEAYDVSEKSEYFIEQLLLLLRNYISYGAEIVEVAEVFFKEHLTLDEECIEFIQQDGVKETLLAFKGQLEQLEDYTPESINTAMNEVKNITGAKGKMLFMPIRIASTGQMHGPDLPKSISLIDKDIVIKRIDAIIG